MPKHRGSVSPIVFAFSTGYGSVGCALRALHIARTAHRASFSNASYLVKHGGLTRRRSAYPSRSQCPAITQVVRWGSIAKGHGQYGVHQDPYLVRFSQSLHRLRCQVTVLCPLCDVLADGGSRVFPCWLG